MIVRVLGRSPIPESDRVCGHAEAALVTTDAETVERRSWLVFVTRECGGCGWTWLEDVWNRRRP